MTPLPLWNFSKNISVWKGGNSQYQLWGCWEAGRLNMAKWLKTENKPALTQPSPISNTFVFHVLFFLHYFTSTYHFVLLCFSVFGQRRWHLERNLFENIRYQIPKLDCYCFCCCVKFNFEFRFIWITATAAIEGKFKQYFDSDQRYFKSIFMFWFFLHRLCLLTCWRSVPQWWEGIPVGHHYSMLMRMTLRRNKMYTQFRVSLQELLFTQPQIVNIVTF